MPAKDQLLQPKHHFQSEEILQSQKYIYDTREYALEDGSDQSQRYGATDFTSEDNYDHWWRYGARECKHDYQTQRYGVRRSTSEDSYNQPQRYGARGSTSEGSCSQLQRYGAGEYTPKDSYNWDLRARLDRKRREVEKESRRDRERSPESSFTPTSQLRKDSYRKGAEYGTHKWRSREELSGMDAHHSSLKQRTYGEPPIYDSEDYFPVDAWIEGYPDHLDQKFSGRRPDKGKR